MKWYCKLVMSPTGCTYAKDKSNGQLQKSKIANIYFNMMLLWNSMEMFLNYSNFCLESIIYHYKSKNCTATDGAILLKEELRESWQWYEMGVAKNVMLPMQLICSMIAGKKPGKLNIFLHVN